MIRDCDGAWINATDPRRDIPRVELSGGYYLRDPLAQGVGEDDPLCPDSSFDRAATIAVWAAHAAVLGTVGALSGNSTPTSETDMNTYGLSGITPAGNFAGQVALSRAPEIEFASESG